MGARSSLEFIRYFLRAYPLRTAVMVAMLLFSGFAEGIGFFTLLPMLELVAGDAGGAPSEISVALASALERIGLGATVGTMLVVISVAMLLKAVFRWAAMRQVGYTVAQVATDLRLRLIRALMHARWSHFVSHSTGDYSAAIATQAHRASASYKEACAGIAGLFQILAYLSVAVLVSWQIAVAALVVGGVAIFFMRGFVKMAREAGREQTDVMQTLIRRLTEALPGIKPVKAMARERFLLPLLERESHGFRDAQQKQVLANESLLSFQEPVLVIFLALGLYGAVRLGDFSFAVVLVLAVLFHRLVSTINQLQGHYQVMAVGESAFEEILNHIEVAEASRETARGDLPAPSLSSEIRFEEVSFGYKGRPVLTSASFVIPAGSFTAFIGPSGAGKTTILDLLVGLQQPEDGRILVDGVDLSHVSMRDWRNGIGYVPQEMVLFHTSIFSNIAQGDDQITREQARQALKDAGAWDFVSRYEEGLDRVVGEGGVMLSGGQRQRIAIARALVRAPRLLILDEATTALDPAVEAEVCDTLRQLSGKVTIVAVSHQLALRQVADQVFELENGVVSPMRTIAETDPAVVPRALPSGWSG